MKIPLGIHGALRSRDAGQRDAVLDAAKLMLDKGSDLLMREDVFWSDVQPTEGGGYNWTVPDSIVADAADKGFRMWLVLSHPPVWATCGRSARRQLLVAMPAVPGCGHAER
ncbi:MAG: hypothetical protein U5N53_11160 [Mycobacterium sp.]|nr:hypothetical protein [Mycobacterium sp.]